jgi:hypothetical protein
MSVNKKADLRLGTHAAPTVLTDLSGSFKKADFNRQLDMFDKTVFNQTTNVKAMETGLQEIKLSGEALWDQTLDTHLHDLVVNGTEIDFQFGPNGGDAGKVRYTGKAIVSNYSTPIEIGQQMLSTVEIHINTLVKGVYP